MKKILRNFMLAALVFVHAMIFSAPVEAAQCSAGVSDPKCNPVCSASGISQEQKNAAGCDTASDEKIGTHVQNIINAAVSAVGLVGVIVIVMAGQRFMSAAGDPGKIKQAKDMVLWAVIGIIVAGLAWAIVTFIAGAIPTN